MENNLKHVARPSGDEETDSFTTGTKDCSKLRNRVRIWWQHQSRESSDSLWVGYELLMLELEGAHGEISATLQAFGKKDKTFARSTAYRNRDRYLFWLTWRQGKTVLLTFTELQTARELAIEPMDAADRACIAANPTVRSLMSFLRKQVKLDQPKGAKNANESNRDSSVSDPQTADWCSDVLRETAEWVQKQTKLDESVLSAWKMCDESIRNCIRTKKAMVANWKKNGSDKGRSAKSPDSTCVNHSTGTNNTSRAARRDASWFNGSTRNARTPTN